MPGRRIIRGLGTFLAALSSIYRVASFIVLGLLLLAGAFAYQRVRVPSLHERHEAG